MLIVKQEGIKYYFLRFWYDLTWDWTLVFRAIGKFYPQTNEPVESVYFPRLLLLKFP